MSFSSDNDDGYTNSITGVAISNQSILVLCSVGFGTIGLVIFIILRHLSTDQDEDEQSNVRRYDDVLDDSDVATLNRAQRRARAKFRMKKARRAPTPNVVGAQVGEGDENVMGGENNQGRDDNDGTVAVDANLSRKERQRAAKAKEREERKVYSEKARVLREKKQSTKTKSEDKNVCDDKEIKKSDEVSVQDIFPRMANAEDALSEYLFWESSMKNLKQTTNSNEEIISIAQSIPKMTINEFVERLKHNGSVSIASLADEFGITIPQALDELERVNKQHGVLGIVDSNGNFVYISMKMIQDAIRIGQDAGRIPFPT